MGDAERCAEFEEFKKIDAAFKAGDMIGLREALGDPEGFPNVEGPITIGSVLVYAIYHSPLSFVRELLESGADPNFEVHDGFPSLMAALSCATGAPGHPGRPDVLQLVELLLTFGADVHQRGINDYTPLHWAAGSGDGPLVEVLLAHGADPSLRTRVDDCETAEEAAARAGHAGIARRLARVRASRAEAAGDRNAT